MRKGRGRNTALAWLALLPFLAAILLHRASSAGLLADSDTAFLLLKIREKGQPFSWFLGDWPLYNHFYRPIATLAFEADNRLYGSNAAGYGFTNALLVMAGVATLYALLRRLFSPVEAWAGAALFALWTLDIVPPISLLASFAILAVIALSIRAKRLSSGILVALGIWAIVPEFGGIEALYSRTIAWLPGRTATVCGLFALLALGAYAASIRLGAEPRESRAVLPTDPPATRNTVIEEQRPRLAQLLFVLSLVATALSLGSYEQGVMVPALIFGVGLLLAREYRVRFGAQSLHWGVLVGYLILRAQLVPVAPSPYQKQVMRFGPGVFLSMNDYLGLRLGDLRAAYAPATMGLEGLYDSHLVLGVVALASVIALWLVVDARSRRSMAIWLGMSALAFLPMAFVKHFEHYHYLPMAIRTGFVISATVGLAGAFRRAASPRAVPAPPRSRPAPGSLPHL